MNDFLWNYMVGFLNGEYQTEEEVQELLTKNNEN
jgi:hypothetical protein